MNSQNCDSGITLTGQDDKTLDSDYMHDNWARESFSDNWFQASHGIFQNPYFLHWNGCFIPIKANYSMCLPKENTAAVYKKWVIMQEYDNPNRYFKIVAICESGCPEDGVWDKSKHYDMQWKLTGEVTKSTSTVKATGSCCPRKVQACDAIHKDTKQCDAKCSKHNGILHIWSPACSLDPCCEFDQTSPYGNGDCVCKKKGPPNVCAKNDVEAIVV